MLAVDHFDFPETFITSLNYLLVVLLLVLLLVLVHFVFDCVSMFDGLLVLDS